MPSKASVRPRPKQNGQSIPSNSSSTTKLSIIVLLISFGLLFAYYDQQQRPHDQKVIPQLDRLIDNTNEAIQQWIRLIWSKGRALFGLTIRADSVLRGLLARENSVDVRADSSIAIGLGACTDLVVESLEIFDKFAAPSNPQPHAQIETMQDLLELFAYYFKYGAASERYIKSKSVFDQLLKLIKKSPHIWREHIGGNAPLMSERFSKEGVERILLGAQVSAAFASQLPEHIEISGPIIEKDDYHILLEYKTGQRWGPYKSPRANRLIVHSDDNNAQLISRSHFFDQASQFKPDLIIVSGLQMLDNSPLAFEVRSKAIEQLAFDLGHLRQSMENARSKNIFKIHFELASYTENQLLGAIVDDIFPHVDSYGMNEQEVANLLSFLKFGNISFVSSPFPRIAHVLDETRELFSLLTLIGDGRVSRIHVHTLAYQVVAVRLDQNGRSSKWPHCSAAMAKASLTAYRHTCGSEQVDLKTARILLDESFTTSIKSEKFKQRIYFDSADPTACWTEELPNQNPDSKHKSPTIKVKFCLAVGMVCTNVIQTGGAGDNVSAGGIVLQI